MTSSKYGKHLDAELIRRLLFKIGEELSSRGKVAEIAMYGGSALILSMDGRAATKDIDYVSVSGDDSDIQEISNAIGEQYGLAENWFNDAVEIFQSHKPDYTLLGDFPPETPGLRVFMATPEYILSMKLLSMRSSFESNDMQDIWLLIDHCEIDCLEKAESLLSKYFPGEILPERNSSILQDFFAAKVAGEEYTPLLGW